MQAIADINLHAEQPLENVQSLQKPQIIQPSSNSVSFEELLSSYKTDSALEKTSDTAPQNPEPLNVESNKIENASTKEARQDEKNEVVEKKADTDKVKESEGDKKGKSDSKDVKLLKKNPEKSSEVKDQKKDVEVEAAAKASELEIGLTRIANLTKKDVQEDSKDVKVSFENADVQNISEEVPDLLKSELKTVQVKPGENGEKKADFADLIEDALLEDDAKEFGPEVSSFEKKNSALSNKKETKIEVTDLRSREQVLEKSEKDSKNEVFAKKSANEMVFDKNEASVTMEINSQNVETNVLSLNNQAAGADGSNYQAMLNNQIQANVPEIVKAGSIVLKDNDQGTINLVLHPDDLGNVKIHISMDGKSLSGHITVQSKEALQVFKDNAETLREAFIKQGFDVSSFDVAMNNGGANQNGNFDNLYDGSEFIARQMYGANSSSSESVDAVNIVQDYEKFSEYSINIVA